MAGTLVSRAFLLVANNTKCTPFSFVSSKLLTAIAASDNAISFTSSSSSFTENQNRSQLFPLSFSYFRTPNSVRHFSSSESNTKINTKVNFSLPSDDEDEDETTSSTATATATAKLPPPYDPFNKKPAVEDPEDPKDLQEVFHRMRSEGLTNNAVKMFDALSKDGLTHEALELFAQIKDKGHMPEVVSHTAVIEAYANAGKTKEALRVYMRMLASGVAPNAYTYSVLIKALAGDPGGKFLGDAKKYLVEMMGNGMKPNAGTYTAVFEGFARREDKADDGRELLAEMKGKGFVPDEKAVREVLKSKRGPVVRSIINLLFGK